MEIRWQVRVGGGRWEEAGISPSLALRAEHARAGAIELRAEAKFTTDDGIPVATAVRTKRVKVGV